MATLAAVLACTHHPFYYRASQAPPGERLPQADEWVAKVEAYRETLTRARPDVLVMVGSDHFHQFFLDNMPQFLIGKAPFYDANYYNEEREFGLPRHAPTRRRGLLRAPAASGHRRRRRLRVLQRTADRPLDHLPDHHRTAAERPADRAGPDQRLLPADAAPGTLRAGRPAAARAHRVVPPRYSGGRDRHRAPVAGTRRTPPIRAARPGPEFDRRAIDWIARGDIDAALKNVSLDNLGQPGNATHGFMDFMLMMGIAGGVPADYADNLDLFHTMEAYFTWYPNGADGMSQYLLNKFLYPVDRDPDLVEAYRADPAGLVARWETEHMTAV